MSKSILQKKRILTKAGGGSSLATPVSVANGGTGISSYAIGDIIYASGTTTLSKLPIGTASQQLRVNAGATALEFFTPAPSGSSLSELTAATGTNTINNANYAQVWGWNSLTTEVGLTLSSSSVSTGSIAKIISTSTVGNASKGLDVAVSGANSTAGKTNYGIYSEITNTGSTSTNYGGYFSASGGTSNYSLGFSGIMGINRPATSSSPLYYLGTNSFGTNLLLGDNNAGGGGSLLLVGTAGSATTTIPFTSGTYTFNAGDFNLSRSASGAPVSLSIRNSNGAAFAPSILYLGNDASATEGFFTVNSAAAAAARAVTLGHVGLYPLLLATNSTERFRINSTGNIFIGNGETNVSPTSGTINATGGSGSNVAGANMSFIAGVGTGSATTNGYFSWSTAPTALGSGTTAQTVVEAVRITKNGDVLMLNAANGLILKDAAATPHYWRVTISTLGVLTTADLGTSVPN